MDEPPIKKLKLVEEENIETQSQAADSLADFTEDVDTVEDKFTLSEDKYTDFVHPDELEKLREFQVLDEVRSNDEDSNDEDSDSSDGKSEVPEEEIEKMLEEDLPEGFKGAPKPKGKPYVTRQKVVLEEKGVNHFEVLPLDWMMVRHYSGMPIYMHRATRVCTLSKPYFLGKGNTRRHEIPISAIPCLAYRRALEEEEKQKEIDRDIEEQIKNGTWQRNKSDTQNITTDNNKTDNVKHSSENIAKCPFSHGEGTQSDSKITIVDVRSVEKTNSSDIVEPTDEKSRNVLNNSTNCDPLIKSKALDEDVKRINGINVSQNKSKCKEQNIGTSENIFKVKNSTSGEIIIRENSDTKDDENVTVGEIIDKSNINLNSQLSTNETSTNDGNKPISKSNETQESNDSQRSDENNEKSSEPAEEQSNADGTVDNGNRVENAVPLNRQPVVLPGGVVMPPPRVETVSTSWKTQHLTHDQLNEYCRTLFKFKTVNIMHFERWADRRKYNKARKTLQCPTLPEGTKLITIPAQPANGHDTTGGGGKAQKRDWVMNMNGRSYLSVFHEYVRRALQKQPVYEFKQLENASTPYQATVYIGGMQYGVGHGSSKRSAKSAAARASIHILIPEMRDELDQQPPNNHTNDPDFSFFDYVGIEDPRITEFCAATCEPSPHAILRTCLLRNFGAQDKHIHTEMKKLEYQKIELTMKVGKHSATVVCKNKKTAKQRASQAILQALHPHVRSWGSLLRLYGSRSVKSCKEKKLEEQQITLLQDAARHNEPNYAVLEKLRHEMRKLRERDEAVVPIGTLLLKDDLPTHSGSNLNNVDL